MIDLCLKLNVVFSNNKGESNGLYLILLSMSGCGVLEGNPQKQIKHILARGTFLLGIYTPIYLMFGRLSIISSLFTQVLQLKLQCDKGNLNLVFMFAPVFGYQDLSRTIKIRTYFLAFQTKSFFVEPFYCTSVQEALHLLVKGTSELRKCRLYEEGG